MSVPASACTAANQTLTCVVNLPTANEPIGSNAVTVAQAADANYSGSTGSGTVAIAMSTVSPVGSTSGGVQNVTINQGTASTLLTATLSFSGATAPTGAVTFTVAGGAPVTASCTVGATQEICTAMYPTASLQIGTYTITSTEAADANYVAGSATGMLTVASGSVSPILDKRQQREQRADHVGYDDGGVEREQLRSMVLCRQVDLRSIFQAAIRWLRPAPPDLRR